MTGNPDKSTPAAGMSPLQMFQFFVLFPCLLGAFNGAASIGFQQFVSVGHHMIYMVVFSLLSWNCSGLGSKFAALVLRPWQPPLMLVLLVGKLVGGFGLWWPLRDLVNLGFESFLAPGSSFGPFWPPPADNLGPWLGVTAQGIILWLLANWVDFRYRRVPRFGFAPPEPPAIPTPAGQPDPDSSDPAVNAAGSRPRLAARLPEDLQSAEIIALEAEEHYTKVHTSGGAALLLLRFADAIAEMEPQPGLQVHRSFWISRQAVERVVRSGRRTSIQMRGGLEVPVSRSFRLQARAAGLSA
jgi:hypothetical protein